MQKFLAITATIVILLAVQFVSTSIADQETKDPAQIKWQAYRDANKNNDFTYFCRDYPEHWKCVDARFKEDNDFTALCRYYPKFTKCVEIKKRKQGIVFTVIFIVFFISLIGGGAYWAIRSNKEKKELDENQKFEEGIQQEFPQAKVYISYHSPIDDEFLEVAESKDIKEARKGTNYDTSFLVIDFEQKQIMVGIREARENPHEQPYKMSFGFSDIAKAEIIRDDNQVVTTNLLVPIGRGSVTGGVSAAKKVLNGAKRIVIRITADNADKPVHEVTFYTSKKEQGGKQGEALFDYAVEKSLEFAVYLDAAVKEARKEQPENNTDVSEQTSRQEVGMVKEEQPENNQSTDVSEQLARLWQLKQEGALTQEEFEAQKARLLQS